MTSDEYCQEFPDYDTCEPSFETHEYAHPVNIERHPVNKPWQGGPRATKGNRKAQSARYYRKNKSKRRAYMKAYMAQRRHET